MKNKLIKIFKNYLGKNNGLYLEMPKSLVNKTNIQTVFVPNIFFAVLLVGVFYVVFSAFKTDTKEDLVSIAEKEGQIIGEKTENYDVGVGLYSDFENDGKIDDQIKDDIYKNIIVKVATIENITGEGGFCDNPNDGASRDKYNKNFMWKCGVSGVLPYTAKNSGLFTDSEIEKHYNSPKKYSLPLIKLMKIYEKEYIIFGTENLNSLSLQSALLTISFNSGRFGTIRSLYKEFGFKTDSKTTISEEFIEFCNEKTADPDDEKDFIKKVFEVTLKSKKNTQGNNANDEGLDKRYILNSLLQPNIKDFFVYVKIKNKYQTLTWLSDEYGTDIETITYINNIEDPNMIDLGQKLLIIKEDSLKAKFKELDKYVLDSLRN